MWMRYTIGKTKENSMFESKGYWLAIRKTGYGELADAETMAVTQSLVSGRIKESEKQCPHWAVLNPVVRIVQVEIKELSE